MKKNHIFADDVRVDYFSLLHCSWIWSTEPYCYSLVVWAKSVAPNLTYCKIFENFTGSYLMCTGFWNVKGATKASLLIPWQRSDCSESTMPQFATSRYHIIMTLGSWRAHQLALHSTGTATDYKGQTWQGCTHAYITYAWQWFLLS